VTGTAKALLTVEMNMGQMVDDVRLEAKCRIPVAFFGRAGGIIPTPSEVVDELARLADSVGVAAGPAAVPEGGAQ
jgi:2-oxoglutarate ferredoxin oxidoreductase subunit alpha